MNNYRVFHTPVGKVDWDTFTLRRSTTPQPQILFPDMHFTGCIDPRNDINGLYSHDMDPDSIAVDGMYEVHGMIVPFTVGPLAVVPGEMDLTGRAGYHVCIMTGADLKAAMLHPLSAAIADVDLWSVRTISVIVEGAPVVQTVPGQITIHGATVSLEVGSTLPYICPLQVRRVG